MASEWTDGRTQRFLEAWIFKPNRDGGMKDGQWWRNIGQIWKRKETKEHRTIVKQTGARVEAKKGFNLNLGLKSDIKTIFFVGF